MDPATGRGAAPERGGEAAAVEQPRLDALRLAAAEGGAAQLAVMMSDDRTPRFVWANRAVLDLLGVELDDLLGAPVEPIDGTVTTEPPRWTAVVTELIAGSDELSRAEHEVWHSATVALPDGRGTAVQVMVTGVGRDGWVVRLRPVTEAERLAEEAQRESEQRFLALAEHAPVGIVLSEAGVRLGFVNLRFAEIAGAERQSLLGTKWLDAVYPEDLSTLLEAVDRVLGGEPTEVAVRMMAPSDVHRWVQLRLSPVTTLRRAAGFIATIEDITARRAWETQLAYQAGHDALTGLANRRSLVEALSQLLASRRSRDREVAVLFCDLDGFKQINDSLGHDAGDRVLIEVGQRLSLTARDHDLVARIAGDEFVVVIREIGTVDDAEAAAARQLAALVPPIRVAGRTVTISASIGVAVAQDYDNATSLLQAADRGMYEAKRAGRGLYRVTAGHGTRRAEHR